FSVRFGLTQIFGSNLITRASCSSSLATADLENERTLAIVKPDGVSGKYISSINKIILESRFTIQRELTLHLDEDSVRSFYAEHSTKSFFPSLVKYMTSSLATADLENERTLAIVKPDGVSGKYISSINKIILESRFTIQRELTLHLDEDSVRSFYAEHSTKSFFPSLVKYMTSGPVLIMVLGKTNAIADWRALIRPTHARKAKVTHPD
nr:probable nucleoside diphosphate kinase 5 isoform X1 [Tanacetum cinerariifolium]